MRYLLFGIVIFILAVPISCATKPIDKAFTKEMMIAKSNKTITQYCQSCHVHRKHNTLEHISTIPTRYSSVPYKSTVECRVCHQITRNFWNQIIRETHMPGGHLIKN